MLEGEEGLRDSVDRLLFTSMARFAVRYEVSFR